MFAVRTFEILISASAVVAMQADFDLRCDSGGGLPLVLLALGIKHLAHVQYLMGTHVNSRPNALRASQNGLFLMSLIF